MQFSSVFATLTLAVVVTALPGGDGCRVVTAASGTTCKQSSNGLTCGDFMASCGVGQWVKKLDNSPQCERKKLDTPCTGSWKCCTK
ncbi:hypothetical protein CORC01_02588 [Colletotrichum orchidophilum]|uniref:Uncharacterized protein n=1 Tax=Colletotrichum orchidophilum TaxID=1209926 RepID=A0A1G4BKM8_9PEZI|nr:uncharacterized protein CORC01_02588 [Colletotrichum orchidophilum]OHF02009.1 hypothetical protein CORC01_02588 [Colletotrichum orchidophilum]